MIRPRCDRAPGEGDRFDRHRLHGTRRDGVEAERSPLMRDPHRPIQGLFHQDVSGPERVMDLVEPPLVHEGEVLAQAPGCDPPPVVVPLTMGLTHNTGRQFPGPAADSPGHYAVESGCRFAATAPPGPAPPRVSQTVLDSTGHPATDQ